MTLSDRFWSKVNKTLGCWLWTGMLNQSGYGQLWLGKRGNRKRLLAHRVSWELHHGTIENDLCVLHKCDNPICVNPEHLFLGTRTDNAIDRTLKGRSKNGTAKITEKDAELIRELYFKTKFPQCKIAHMFQLDQSEISRIVNMERWV